MSETPRPHVLRGPALDLGHQPHAGGPVVPAVGVVGDSYLNAALAGAPQEALHLGGDVELVLTAVSHEQIELAGAQLAQVDQLQRVDAADLVERLGPVAEQRPEQLAEA